MTNNTKLLFIWLIIVIEENLPLQADLLVEAD